MIGSALVHHRFDGSDCLRLVKSENAIFHDKLSWSELVQLCFIWFDLKIALTLIIQPPPTSNNLTNPPSIISQFHSCTFFSHSKNVPKRHFASRFLTAQKCFFFFCQKTERKKKTICRLRCVFERERPKHHTQFSRSRAQLFSSPFLSRSLAVKKTNREKKILTYDEGVTVSRVRATSSPRQMNLYGDVFALEICQTARVERD
jgi:hypothetical protein